VSAASAVLADAPDRGLLHRLASEYNGVRDWVFVTLAGLLDDRDRPLRRLADRQHHTDRQALDRAQCVRLDVPVGIGPEDGIGRS
jgi:hypothetical protein